LGDKPGLYPVHSKGSYQIPFPGAMSLKYSKNLFLGGRLISCDGHVGFWFITRDGYLWATMAGRCHGKLHFAVNPEFFLLSYGEKQND